MDISITLNKAPGQSLGIGFKKMPQPPYCQVYKLVSDGAARQSGKVQEGDMLLCVNGHNVQHLTPDEVRKVLSRCTQDTSILFELRRPYIPSTHNGNSAILSPDDIPNGHLPSNSSPQSPEIPDVATVSPDTSPSLGTRSRRPPVYGGLPGIQETTSPMLNISHLAPQDHQRTQRHSLTPQSRTPEVARRINQMSLKPAKSLDLANLPQWRQHSTPQVPLRNLITETETHDRLHTQGVKVRERKRGGEGEREGRERERERERKRGPGGGGGERCMTCVYILYNNITHFHCPVLKFLTFAKIWPSSIRFWLKICSGVYSVAESVCTWH